jgi:hypothetical protein
VRRQLGLIVSVGLSLGAAGLAADARDGRGLPPAAAVPSHQPVPGMDPSPTGAQALPAGSIQSASSAVLRASVLLPELPAEHQHWHVHQTPNFNIAHDRDTERAIQQGDLLEATHRRFYETLGGPDFMAGPLSERMEALLFEDKDAYLAYARQADRVDMSWTVAYYSARTNRIAFYRYGGTRPRPAESGERQADGQLYGAAAGHETPQVAHAARVSLASATHEAAHQLAFNSGLQTRGVMYPLWVSEGLATNFELHEPGGDFGPEFDNPVRRARLQQVHRRGEMLDLHSFVSVTRPPTDDARLTDAYYAQSWGLFRYLYLHQRAQLANYLAELASLPRGSRDRDTLRREFVRHFGPILDVELGYNAWIAGNH